jgi:hypothetical protein
LPSFHPGLPKLCSFGTAILAAALAASGARSPTRSTRTGKRNCSRMPTHQTRILHLCHSSLPHIQTGSPCISHSVCYRLRTQAISGPVERPGEGAEARTRLRQQLVSRRTLASIHSWPVMLCAAVCGISVVCLWRCEMRVWGV